VHAEYTLANCQRLLPVRPGLADFALYLQHPSDVVEQRCHVGVVLTQRALRDLERLLVLLERLVQLALRLQHRSYVVETDCDSGVVVAQRALADR